MKGLNGIPYPSEGEQEEDVRYFLKKMGWTKEQLNEYIKRPEKLHSEYPTEKPLWDMASKIYRLLGWKRKRI